MATHNRVQRWDSSLGRTKDTGIVDNDDRVELDKPLKGNRGVGFRFRKLTSTRNRLTSKDHTVVVEMTSPAANTQFLPIGAERFDGQQIVVCDGTGDAETNPITVDGGDKAIHGSFTHIHQVNGGQVTYVYSDTLNEWRIVNVADRSQVTVGSYAALRLVAGSTSGATKPRKAHVTGRSTVNDGGEGDFVWESGGSDDDGFYIVAPGGRWKRITKFLTPEMYGAKFDGTADDTVPIQASITAGGVHRLPVQLKGGNSGRYRITQPLVFAVDTCPIFRGASQQNGDVSQYTILEWDGTPTLSGAAATVASPVGGVSTVTGLTGMVATDVGSWILFPGICAYGSGIRAMEIKTYNSATSVDVINISGVSGAGLSWMFDKRPVLDVHSRESKISGIVIRPLPNRYFFAGLRDITEPGYTLTKNQFDDIKIWNEGATSLRYFAFGIVHADNITQPGFPATSGVGWPPNGENNFYYNVQVNYCEVAGVYCPNRGGQAKKHIFDNCVFVFGPYAVWWKTGGIVMRECDLGANHNAILRIEPGGLDQCHLIDCLSEHSARMLDMANNTGAYQTLMVTGGRYDCALSLAADGYYIKAHGNSMIRFQGVNFQASGAPLGYNVNWKVYADNEDNGGSTDADSRGCSITFDDCFFPTNTPMYRATTRHTSTFLNCKGFHPTGGTVPIRNEIEWPNGDTSLYPRTPMRLGFYAKTETVVNTATYTALLTDQFLLIDRTTTSACAVTLPATPFDGQEITVKDSGGQASARNITIAGAVDIDGSSGLIIATDWGRATVRYSATKTLWHRVS